MWMMMMNDDGYVDDDDNDDGYVDDDSDDDGYVDDDDNYDNDINISHIFLLPAVLVINPPTVKKIALLGILQW